MKSLTQRFAYLNMLALFFISFLLAESVSAQGVNTNSQNHRVKIWVKSFIPYPRVDMTPFGPCFSGDNRTFSDAADASCRTHQEIEFDITSRNLVKENSFTGKTHRVNCKTNNPISSAQASSDGLHNGPVTINGQTIRVKMALAAGNPLVLKAPDIDLEIFLDFDWPDWAVTLSGRHDGFPAFEIYMSVDGGKPVELYQFRTAGNSIFEYRKLFPPMDEVITPRKRSLGIPNKAEE
jgi:hypothetical protein